VQFIQAKINQHLCLIKNTGMPSFIALRDRDAWSTIRGYVYQIDITIQRWLDLLPNQVLELERGEDIDIVSRSLIAGSEERDRLLEQVKHRDSSLTLRKPEAITAIANFIEHCQTNLTADLIFQFTTNAKVSRERLSPMPNQMPAIDAWERLRMGEIKEENRSEFIAGIRQILGKSRKPDDLQEDTWQTFCTFNQTATDEQFLNLICNFQWRTHAPEARSIKSLLQKQLLDKRYAIDSLQAQEQYQRLFWYVFSRLSESGRKQLTPEELSNQLTLPSLSSSDRETLETLKIWFDEIDSRITNLEQGQQQSNHLLNSLSVEVQQLARSQGIDGAINYVVETPILDVYPLAEHSSLREETVQELAQILENHTWIAIDGSLGSGKTQLAVLLVQYLTSQGRCTNCIWLRLRDLTVEQACLRFDQAVEILVGRPSKGSFTTWYSQLSDCLNPGTILVFDDLPQLTRGDELEARLTQLAQICHSRGIRLLSTSFHQLPQNLQSVLGNQLLFARQVPTFTNSEARDLFRAYDAPESFIGSDWVSYLNGLANRHPSLLAAIAEYLHTQNWQFTPETFDALLRGAHAVGVNEETLNRILRAIQDEQSQELLYRLNLILGYFFTEDMQALAEVLPSVERPRQRLHSLLGVWIQRDINNRLMVSPLVKALGSGDLNASVCRECHLTLGERIVRNELNQYKAFNAIFHFNKAEAFNKAGSLFLFSLDRLEDSETHIDDGGLLALWSLQPLPEQMDLGIRLLIRGFQISVNVSRNRSVAYFLEDLDGLVEQVTDQESAMMMSLVTALISKCPEQVDFSRLNNYFQVALRFSSRVRLPDGSELSLPQEAPFESLIWVIARNIQTSVDLENWIATLEQLTLEQREQAFSARATEAGCLYVTEKLWLREGDKLERERDWQGVLAATQKLVESASNLGLELLWACATCSEVIILAEYLGSLNQAIEVAESAIANASDNPRVQFLLKECLGRQLIFANRHNDAVTWLDQALVQPTEAYPTLRLYALLRLSRAIADQEPYLAIQYAQQAVNLAKSSKEIPETELVKALGELAIAKWLTIDLSAAFEVWDKAGEYLLNSKPLDEERNIDSNYSETRFSEDPQNILQILIGNTAASNQFIIPAELFRSLLETSAQSSLSNRASQSNRNIDAWKDLFAVFAHICGYFTALAKTGNPPVSTEAGEAYEAPRRGIFLTRNSARVSYYNPSRDCFLPTQLASLAEAIGDDERSLAWALRGLDMAREAQQLLPLVSLGRNIIPQLVLENRYAEVLDLAVELGRLLVVLPQVSQSGRNILEPGIDVQAVLDSSTRQFWRNTESFAMILGVLPIIFHIADLAIRQPELARRQAIDLAAMCREILDLSDSQSLWITAVEIIEQIHLQQSTCVELISQYQSLSSPDRILPILGLMTATLQENAPLLEVLRVHLSIIEQVQRLVNPQSTAYRRIILPYLLNYWRTAVEKVMFRFNDPQQVANILYQVQNLPIEQQSQAILSVIQDFLIM
jgi:hypothetical protein